MATLKAQKLGGKATAQKLRTEALARYYANPNHCTQCHKIIIVKEHKKIRDVKVRKFCNKSCAAKFNNPTRLRNSTPKSAIKRRCKKCGTQFEVVRLLNGTPSKQKICFACTPNTEASKKRELFNRRSSWQSARSAIQKHARLIYNSSDKAKACVVCGYDKHYDVAHITPVAQFSDTATISEINHIDNLIALCPNHHWEFDQGLLSL